MRHVCESTVLREKKKQKTRSGAFSYGKNKCFRKVQIWHPIEPPSPTEASPAGKCQPTAQQQNSSRWRPAVLGCPFFIAFLGRRPETCWYHLQETACEHGCCCSRLGTHTAVCGQSNRVPHSRPAKEGDKCPSLQQEVKLLQPKSNSLNPLNSPSAGIH